jgi:oligopeptide/dipeptide ABC transporter ATP-binding protein
VTVHMPKTDQAFRSSPPGQPLLSVSGLQVAFYTEVGTVNAVQDVSLHVDAGETLAVVGESGSGKSITAMSIMGLLPLAGEVEGGEIRWRGEALTPKTSRRLRGSRMTMIFQDPMASLNPLVTVGGQITEVLRKHKGMDRRRAKARAIELFELVGIPEPRQRLKQYPFEFSGGMAQRVMIAIALAPDPDLIIADEPTTALDVTIQAQILALITDLQRRTGVAMMLITHDLGVVAGVADRVVVMYGGRVVEDGTAHQIFTEPRHPYTQGLLASTPHPYAVRQRLVPIKGSPPTTARVVPGCAFDERCPYVQDRCREQRPPLEAGSVPVAVGAVEHRSACWFPLDRGAA